MRESSPPAATAKKRVRMRLDQRDYVAVSHQLLLCTVVLALLIGGTVAGVIENPQLFAIGAFVVAIGVVLSFAVPWQRLSPRWLMLLPIADVCAVALMRIADPSGGVGLLWVFPAMWLATFGIVGLALSCILIPALYWVLAALDPDSTVTFATLLLPLVIVVVSSVAYGSVRRNAAHNELIEAQAARLAFARSTAVRQEQLVSEVLDSVDFGVVRFSVGGDVVYENDVAGRLSRLIPGLHAAAPRAVQLQEDGRTPLDASDHPLARARRGETFEDELVWTEDAEGVRVALTFSARRLVDHRGEDSGAVLTTRDVTSEREAMQARDQLVASVSHELRTPLTSVLGYLELALDEDDLSDRARRHLDTAYLSGERLMAIVADILTASRSSRHSLEAGVHARSTDVVPVVRAAVLAQRPQAADRVLKVTVTGAESAFALADPARLRQVVDNLLGNAIKFNRDGGTVEIGVSSNDDVVTIDVSDTGIGIEPDDAAHVFERFYRAAEDVPGNGLGLAISSDIVEAHGGRLTVRSERGVGSTFTIELPAAPSEGASA